MLSCGMDDGQEQGNYEERLREVFDSFDTNGVGSLSPEELSELCQSLHLDDATPVLQALLQNQDHLDTRVRQQRGTFRLSPRDMLMNPVCVRRDAAISCFYFIFLKLRRLHRWGSLKLGVVQAVCGETTSAPGSLFVQASC